MHLVLRTQASLSVLIWLLWVFTGVRFPNPQSFSHFEDELWVSFASESMGGKLRSVPAS